MYEIISKFQTCFLMSLIAFDIFRLNKLPNLHVLQKACSSIISSAQTYWKCLQKPSTTSKFQVLFDVPLFFILKNKCNQTFRRNEAASKPRKEFIPKTLADLPMSMGGEPTMHQPGRTTPSGLGDGFNGLFNFFSSF